MAEREENADADVPSGLPPNQTEEEPMGVPAPSPEGEDEPARGPEAMPGIPAEGEPPAAS